MKASRRSRAPVDDGDPAVRGRALDRALIALLCLVWGSTWIVIKVGLEDLPPFRSGAARFLLAAIAFTAFARAYGRRESGARPPFWLSATVGVLNFGLSYAIVYWSETRLPSGITSVLWAVFPMTMAASAHFFLPGERLRPVQLAGFVIGFAGVVVLFVTDVEDLGRVASSAALVLLGSPLAATIGTTVLKRHGARTSSILVNRDALWVGAAMLAAAAWAFERGEPATWSPSAIASVAYVALFGTALTFGLYFWLLRRTAAHALSLISYATPAIALVLGALVGGEPIGAGTAAGSVLILAGVATVLRGRRADEPAPAPPPAERAERSAAKPGTRIGRRS